MRTTVLKIIFTIAPLILPVSLVANSLPDRDPDFVRFKQKMTPKVGRRMTVTGALASGKLGGWLPFSGWGIYIYARQDSDIDKENTLYRFLGHTITVTGVLRHYADSSPLRTQTPPNVVAAVAPEHFFFDLAEVKLISTRPPRPKDGGSQSPAPTTRPSIGATLTAPLPDGVAAKDVRFYSEGIQCYGKIFTPKGFSAESKVPAVALAPDWGETAPSIEKHAAHFAARGLVAMVIDYRGWGRSGGFLQTVDEVKTDDRLRFSQMTARVRIRRRRLIPREQILDIRNALFYLQGEPGVDSARIGVWGVGLAGGHVMVIAATDARIKAAVAQAPIIEGKDTPKKAFAPSGELLLAEQKRARAGQTPAIRGSADAETRLALAEYHPFWSVEQIPRQTAALFVIAEKDAKVNNETNAIAASKLIKGPTGVVSVPGATHARINHGSAFDTSVNAAAEWFLKHL